MVSNSNGGRWLLSLFAVVLLTAGCSTSGTAQPAPTTGPSEDERQALAAYEDFWSVTDAAFAAPGRQDWTPRIREVATGQAFESLRRDVDNYASIPAHSVGAVKRAPRVSGTTAGRADIVDCVDLGDSRLVSDADGRVLDDLANRVSRYTYRAGLVSREGRWLVDQTVAALDQPC